MAKPDEPLVERVRYTKMVLNSNPIEHLVAELYKAYDYIDELERLLAVQPEPVNRNPDLDPNLDPDLKQPDWR